eukprot:scaffold77807_cov27-Tisochrysis_lutea.AAC.2
MSSVVGVERFPTNSGTKLTNPVRQQGGTSSNPTIPNSLVNFEWPHVSSSQPIPHDAPAV